MATALKKPPAKPVPAAITKAAPAKPVTKIGGAKAATATKPVKEKPVAAPLPDLQISNIVHFKGYATERKPEEVAFAKDEATGKMPRLAIVGIDDTAQGKLYTVVGVDDYWKYTDERAAGATDEQLTMTADQLFEGEIKRGTFDKEKNSYPVVPERPKPVEVLAVGKMDEYLAANEGDYLKMATTLVGESEQSLFYAGGALANLKDKKLYCEYENPATPGVGYTPDGKGWQAFVGDNFPENFGHSKAESYIRIYSKISVLPNADEIVAKLNDIGYSKAAMMAGFITAENSEEIVSDASTQSVLELKSTLQTKYTSSDGKNAAGKAAQRTVVKVLTISYKFYEDTATGIQYVLDAAKKKLGLDDNGTFETIVMQWATENLGADEVSKAQARKTAKIKQYDAAGVKFPKDHPIAVARAAATAAASSGVATAATPAKAPAAPLKPASAAKAALSGLKGGAKRVAAAA